MTNTSPPTRIDLCICTYQRESVTTTLASIAQVQLPPACEVHILIADNDETPSAQVAVRAAAAAYGLALTYLHAPAKNIAVARNACLDAATGDYLAFIDDDEVVSPGWLTTILKTAKETQATATLGPVLAIYGPGTPRWLVAGNFHSTYPTYQHEVIRTGYTGNVLLHRADPVLSSLRFAEAFGAGGGEDADFFYRLTHAGGRIAYAPEARAYEAVPRACATRQWLVARQQRYGHAYANALRLRGGNLWLEHISARAKAAYGFTMVLMTILHPVRRIEWLLRAMQQVGVVKGLRQ